MKLPRTDNFIKLSASYETIIKRCLLECLPINIFLVDNEGYVCWANEHLLKAVGVNLDQARGMHISHWSYARWRYIYEVIMNQETTFHEEAYANHHFVTIRKPLFDERDNIMGVLGVAVEITKSKKSEIAKEQFLNNIRHDIRTPLSGIIGLAEVLRDAVDSIELTPLIDSLIETSEALLTLLDNVFESVKISTGELSRATQTFSLQEVLQTVYKLHHAKAKEKNLELIFHYDPDLPIMVVGDAIRLQRLVWELLTNAVKYTDKGSISLKAYLLKVVDDKTMIEIRVKDTGIGIPENKQEMIFRRCTRLISSWTGSVVGQGLGLFNVKQLIEELEGKLYLESAVDQGSLFTCHLTFKSADPKEEESVSL